MNKCFALLTLGLFINTFLIAQNADLEIERPAPYLKLIDSDHASDDMNANGIIGAYGNNGDGSLATGRLWYLGSSSSSSFDAIFGNQTPMGKLLFATNGAARMAIDASGNIGIGTTSPSAKLDVVGTTELNGNTSIFGDVGIGTASPSSPLDVRSSDASRDILLSRATWTAGTNSNRAAIVGINDVDAGFGFGVAGAGGQAGVVGNSANNGAEGNGGAIGVLGSAYFNGSLTNGMGVSGQASTGGIGVRGSAGLGVQGTSNANGGKGVRGESKIAGPSENIGVIGEGSGSTNSNIGGFFQASGAGPVNIGVFGRASGATSNFAGAFDGNVSITGSLAKGSGSFKIDHPLDPENKYLYHSFVESPDMMNVYNGNITTDGNGLAAVELPTYFMALNQDFRYQLTVIGTFAQAIIKEEISENRFVIQTNEPSVKVSWQITGIRKDPYAIKNRIQEEVDKAPNERGLYLHPEAYGQPASMGISAKMMKAVKLERADKKAEDIN